MGWQDILKNRSHDTAQEILISFREFTPIREITKEEEERVLSSMYYDTKPLVYKRTLEFMKPINEIKREGLNFVFNFDIEGVTFEFKMPFLSGSSPEIRGIGERATDTFPEMKSTGMRFCVKTNRVITNGDFMVTLALASKNNQLPTILTLPAYVEKHMPEIKLHEQGKHYTTIYDADEFSYKYTLLQQIWEHVEGLVEIDWPVFGDDDLHHHGFELPINIINNKLEEYIPEELLEGW